MVELHKQGLPEQYLLQTAWGFLMLASEGFMYG
jgi:hypothetical protein